jgi:hypothetical protein
LNPLKARVTNTRPAVIRDVVLKSVRRPPITRAMERDLCVPMLNAEWARTT